eukprot:scaffold12055_cov63-Phaeocystis_antarctica.AAC.1
MAGRRWLVLHGVLACSVWRALTALWFEPYSPCPGVRRCPGGAPGARCCGDAGTVLQWLREAAHFLQDGMRVGLLFFCGTRGGGCERSCDGWGAFSGRRCAIAYHRREAMQRWRRTWRARVGQAAGVVQAGVVRTGRHGAGGRAAGGSDAPRVGSGRVGR